MKWWTDANHQYLFTQVTLENHYNQFSQFSIINPLGFNDTWGYFIIKFSRWALKSFELLGSKKIKPLLKDICWNSILKLHKLICKYVSYIAHLTKNNLTYFEEIVCMECLWICAAKVVDNIIFGLHIAYKVQATNNKKCNNT